ncbi:MAG: MFS transporter [Coriobacteriia bacterium]|nr:MFS transporter [Coriobacteriia bacterium]
MPKADVGTSNSEGWGIIALLGAAQFVMVIDATVMNVSISRIVEDLGTTVVGIQTAITAFTLVMAAFMLTGGKLGDRLGAKRAFAIGLVIYGAGSLTTALSPNLGFLLLGWSLLEGLGAVLVIPAIVALISANYSGQRRAMGFGIIGGIAGAAAAAGPIIGGLVTTYATWRLVFGVETAMCAGILIASRRLASPTPDTSERFDIPGSVLSVLGLGALVYGVLQSSQWGWVTPTAGVPQIGGKPFAPLGYSPVMWLILAGVGLIAGFVRWEQRVQRSGAEPLLDLALLRIANLKAGLSMLMVQQIIVAGTFFVLPLYLQTVLGLDAFATGLRLMPLSGALLVFALGGSSLSTRYSPRAIVRVGVIAMLLSEIALQVSIDTQLRSVQFGVALGLLGAGLGLLASQLSNVNLSSVPAERGSEVGGLQGTAQNLGASLGTALIGAMLISSLGTGFVATIRDNPDLPAGVAAAAETARTSGLDFVPSSVVREAAAKKLPADQVDQVVTDYEIAQIDALKRAVGVLALLALVALWFVRDLPGRVVDA